MCTAIAPLPRSPAASCSVAFQVAIKDVPAHLISYTRLNSRLVRRDGRWRVQRLVAIYERDTLTPAFPGDSITVASTDVVGLRSSYALLTY